MNSALIKTPFHLESWITYSIVIIGCIIMGLILRWFLFWTFRFSNKRNPSVLIEQVAKHLKTPTKYLLPILFIYGSFSVLEFHIYWHKITEALIIINITWILIGSLNGLEEIVKQKFNIKSIHVAKDRKILTQLRFIKSISLIVLITLAIAAILWNIPAARKLGTTILTSAGVIGIIVGVAAQKSLANLITGFQIAFTQPIKIDDEVAIEGEFGMIEDITLTYVVIKIWDKRRLVLPLTYFNDKPFVNWTFNSPDLIGSVFLYVDYTFPVQELRIKLLEILKGHPLWDKKTAELLVTNSDALSMELRATFSARNATDVWNISYEIREQLITYIKQNHPLSLPKMRRMEVV